MFTIILLVLSVALNIGFFLVVRKLFVRYDQYDQFFIETQNRLTAVINTMKAIDVRGSFEADDEVGSIFDQIKTMIQALDVFLAEEVDEETEKAIYKAN
jgi:hypothetical protein